MRHWLGSSVLACIGIVIGAISIRNDAPLWFIVLVICLAILGATLTWPVRRDALSNSPSTFIRGDASGSTMRDVQSNAHTFIDGDARETLFERVVHRRWRR